MWLSHRVKVGQDGRHQDQFVMVCNRKCLRTLFVVKNEMLKHLTLSRLEKGTGEG